MILMRAPLEANEARSQATEVGSRARRLGGGIATHAVHLSPRVGRYRLLAAEAQTPREARGLLVRLRSRQSKIPLPSIYLANVQSLPNKMDDLLSRIKTQREARDCSVFCLTETWLHSGVPESSLQPPGFSVYRSDRVKERTGKSKGGGVCFLINELWCTDCVIVNKTCNANLECLIVKCRPFYLPREFSVTFLCGVYIHPRADTSVALSELSEIVHNFENSHVNAVVIVAGDFNKCNFKTAFPNYYQHVKHPTRGAHILDHCYSNVKSAYQSSLRPAFGKSDHSSVLLLPTYIQRSKQSKPSSSIVQCWTKESEVKLQGCFDATDWSVFHSENLDEYCDE